jgi:hypothetical protein
MSRVRLRVVAGVLGLAVATPLLLATTPWGSVLANLIASRVTVVSPHRDRKNARGSKNGAWPFCQTSKSTHSGKSPSHLDRTMKEFGRASTSLEHLLMLPIQLPSIGLPGRSRPAWLLGMNIIVRSDPVR